jgi:hypothetical protein
MRLRRRRRFVSSTGSLHALARAQPADSGAHATVICSWPSCRSSGAPVEGRELGGRGGGAQVVCKRATGRLSKRR